MDGAVKYFPPNDQPIVAFTETEAADISEEQAPEVVRDAGLLADIPIVAASCSHSQQQPDVFAADH
jgi:hypothetical protein